MAGENLEKISVCTLEDAKIVFGSSAKRFMECVYQRNVVLGKQFMVIIKDKEVRRGTMR